MSPPARPPAGASRSGPGGGASSAPTRNVLLGLTGSVASIKAPELVAKLLEAGAKATLVNAGGRTALDEAMHNDRQACVDAIMKASGVEEEEANFEDDVEVEGEEAEDQGPETEADR